MNNEEILIDNVATQFKKRNTMNKLTKFILVLALGCPCFATANAQDYYTDEADRTQRDPLSCTSIMVGKKASADGSVITSHTCDSWYRTWMTVRPAADYKEGEMENIYDGRMHTEWVEDMSKVVVKGQIPQVSHTYRLLDTSYPCLNEKQLGMGETTISGRDTLRNKNGMFMIEELQRVALERCTTAREAIKLMGELVKQYGYGDSGECLTIADTKEVWIFEIFGEGPDKIGGVWAAQRIQDDEVAVSANIPRISTLNLKDKNNYMASDNVFDVAKKLGLWDGKEPFKFWKAYGGPNYSGDWKNYSTREFFIYTSLAPSLGLTEDMEEMPLGVKPEKLVTVEEVARLLGSYYEGTEKDLSGRLKVAQRNRKTGEMDTIVSPVANPWMRSDEIALYAALGDDKMKWTRTVAVPQCAYSTIIQLRDWLPDAVGGVVWMSLDNPGESPRFPIFCGTASLPGVLKVCGNHRYRDDSALWHYRQTNKLATVRWGTCRKTLEPARDYFLKKGMRELPFVEETYKSILEKDGNEEAEAFLTNYTADFVGATILKWDELYRTYWRQFWSGF